jgi:Fe-S-cluster containining protein
MPQDIKEGFQWDPARPYVLARGPDGYCLYLDRRSRTCSVWDKRPIRCRLYNCEGDVCLAEKVQAALWQHEHGQQRAAGA